MSLRGFLSRRMSRIVPCELRLPSDGTILLDSKYQIASFQDVFCHPFYWTACSNLQRAPQLVIDCGAHCGHFSILADAAIRMSFPHADPRFILIEPNPRLQKPLAQNMNRTGLRHRFEVIEGLVGASRGGEAVIRIDRRTYLSAGLDADAGEPVPSKYVDLLAVVGGTGGPDIDVLKLDIEGPEFGFMRQYPDILRRTHRVIAEFHSHSGHYDEARREMLTAGLLPFLGPFKSGDNILASFQRPGWE